MISFVGYLYQVTICRVLNPVFYGDYPDELKKRARTRIPSFSKQESEQIKGSCDFIGVNNYCETEIKDSISKKRDTEDFYADMGVDMICMTANAFTKHAFNLTSDHLIGSGCQVVFYLHQLRFVFFSFSVSWGGLSAEEVSLMN